MGRSFNCGIDGIRRSGLYPRAGRLRRWRQGRMSDGQGGRRARLAAGIGAAWIRRRQGSAPEDLRNARMLAVLLVFMGLYLPATLVLHTWLRPWQAMSAPAVGLSVAATTLVWLCYLLLRRGRFNMAVVMFMAVTLVSLGWSYLRWGLGFQVGAQMITLLPPLLGALLLGRWVLWGCAAVLLAFIGGGAWVDIARHFYDPVMVRSASL